MNMQTDPHCTSTLSWRAIFAGAVVAFGLIFLFNLLTIGGGLAAYTKTEEGLEVLVFLAYLWTVVGSFIMLFIAGFVTSMVLCNRNQNAMTGTGHCHGILHGFITWVVYIMISLGFLSNLTGNTVVAFPQSFTSSSSTMESTSPSQSTVTSSSRTTNRAHQTTTNPTTEKQAHALGVATLAGFFIFLVEAIGCCYGASCCIDMCKRKHR